MESGKNPKEDSSKNDPFKVLGLEPGADFDSIQKAKEKKLLEVNQDPLDKARIEAAYDSLLMVSLKSRQLGNASNEALIASKKENSKKEAGGSLSDGSLLTRLKSIGGSSNPKSSTQGFLPELNLPVGQGLTIRISIGVLVFILVLVSPLETIELILSLSTIGLFISQISRGRKPFPSIGWCVLLLSIGLLVGGILPSGGVTESMGMHSFSADRLEAVPAIILLWLGSLLLA